MTINSADDLELIESIVTTVGRSVITTTAPAAGGGGAAAKAPAKGASTPVAVVGAIRSKDIVTHFNDMSGNHMSVVGLVVASVSARSWECAREPARGGVGGVRVGGASGSGAVGGGGGGGGEPGVLLDRPMSMEEVRRRLTDGPYPLFVQLSDMVELAVRWAPHRLLYPRNVFI